jgi:hypothetical protein
MIRRRHVFYVEGYDPQGAEGYHNLFSRSLKRSLKIWPLTATVSPLQIDSDDLAHWEIETAGPNWSVSTRYDFLRQEQMIRANMALPMWRQAPRALGWMFDYLFGGTIFRVFRASWQYGLALIYFQSLLLGWLAVSVLAGSAAAWSAARFAGLHPAIAVAVGIVAAVAAFKLLRPLADYLFVVQINSHWPHLLDYARGKPSCFDRPVDTGARHLVAIAATTDAEELLVVGHSGGGVIAPAVVARALELDPDLGRRGPRLVLLTPGSLMPGVGLHRRAVKVHAAIARIATEPSLLWIDVQARKDTLNFWNFDPVGGIGLDVGAARCNPLVWKVRLREMIAPELYRRLRLNMFRMHYQFIMANDQRAPYDYAMLTCGPVAVEDWARRGGDMLAAFDADARYDAGAAGSTV